MRKSTLSVNGGAMPKIDRRAVMARAWEIFRQIYCYPRIKFADIGRKCFGWALKEAWREAREAARFSTIPAAVKAERIETLQCLIQRASYIDSGPQWKAAVTAYRNEIKQLQTA